MHVTLTCKNLPCCCAQVRLSILCAYLFGKSALFVSLLRWAGHVGALLRTAAQPVAMFLGRVAARQLTWPMYTC